jgi:hypothetical protein
VLWRAANYGIPCTTEGEKATPNTRLTLLDRWYADLEECFQQGVTQSGGTALLEGVGIHDGLMVLPPDFTLLDRLERLEKATYDTEAGKVRPRLDKYNTRIDGHGVRWVDLATLEWRLRRLEGATNSNHRRNLHRNAIHRDKKNMISREGGALTLEDAWAIEAQLDERERLISKRYGAQPGRHAGRALYGREVVPSHVGSTIERQGLHQGPDTVVTDPSAEYGPGVWVRITCYHANTTETWYTVRAWEDYGDHTEPWYRSLPNAPPPTFWLLIGEVDSTDQVTRDLVLKAAARLDPDPANRTTPPHLRWRATGHTDGSFSLDDIARATTTKRKRDALDGTSGRGEVEWEGEGEGEDAGDGEGDGDRYEASIGTDGAAGANAGEAGGRGAGDTDDNDNGGRADEEAGDTEEQGADGGEDEDGYMWGGKWMSHAGNRALDRAIQHAHLRTEIIMAAIGAADARSTTAEASESGSSSRYAILMVTGSALLMMLYWLYNRMYRAPRAARRADVAGGEAVGEGDGEGAGDADGDGGAEVNTGDSDETAGKGAGDGGTVDGADEADGGDTAARIVAQGIANAAISTGSQRTADKAASIGAKRTEGDAVNTGTARTEGDAVTGEAEDTGDADGTGGEDGAGAGASEQVNGFQIELIGQWPERPEPAVDASLPPLHGSMLCGTPQPATCFGRMVATTVQTHPGQETGAMEQVNGSDIELSSPKLTQVSGKSQDPPREVVSTLGPMNHPRTRVEFAAPDIECEDPVESDSGTNDVRMYKKRPFPALSAPKIWHAAEQPAE